MIVGTAGCGLRYAIRRRGSSVGYCALSIGCGTRDEEGYHNGIAHFTEHTIFKGTATKTASVINGYLDRLGGELNAYTTKEEIVLHATVLKEDLAKAAGLLFELAVCPIFPEKEVVTERSVVLDEIQSYKDSPADEVYDRFEEALFAGHDLGRPILGTASSVKKITSEELKRFVDEHFTPDRMAFSLVADIDETRMEKVLLKLIRRYFPSGSAASAPAAISSTSPEAGSLERSEAGIGRQVGQGVCGQTWKSLPNRKQSCLCGLPRCEGEDAQRNREKAAGDNRGQGPIEVPGNRFDKIIDKRNHEVNAVIGGLAPSLYDFKDRITAVLLANILGGPASNSILNEALREKNGWVYGVECGYTQYKDAGIMTISLGCDRENLEKCFMAIRKAVSDLQKKPFCERRLKAAKKQLLGQLAISSESGESQCLSMCKSLLAYGRISSDDENKAAIEAVSAEDLRCMAGCIFNDDNLSRLVFL